jgi:hypothetical protein
VSLQSQCHHLSTATLAPAALFRLVLGSASCCAGDRHTCAMPKLSKRKQQLRNSLLGARIGEEVEGEGEYEDEDDEGESSDVEVPAPKASAKEKVAPKKGASRVTGQGKWLLDKDKIKGKEEKKEKEEKDKKEKEEKKAEEDERVWVQCNTCDKWRALPSTVDPDKLPDIWVCNLNPDAKRRSCNAAEENYKLPEDEQHAPLKSFLKVWTKKLKCADRAENRLSKAALTRGKKRKVDAEWVQCSNPSCGKWRAVTRSIDVAALLRWLNKGKFYGGEGKWFCSMNSWDETTASCSAPQEPLWNCRWNMHGR